MVINGVDSLNSYTGILGPGLSPPNPEDENHNVHAVNFENMDISNSGKIMNAVSQMSEEEKAEMRAFHEEVIEAVKNSTFDATEMAANAPESLTALSEETGIDLEQIIEGMASGPQETREAPPPPPPMLGGPGSTDMSEEELEEMEAFRETLMSAVNDGSFDAAEMAANAPESMAAFAEENGFDLEQMIEGMAQGPKGHMGAPPPPPPMMYNANGMGLAFEGEDDNYLLSGLILTASSDEKEQV